MQTTMPINQTITEEQIQMIKNAIEAMQSSRRAEVERAGQIERSRNALLARDLEARKAREAVRPCLADRVWEKAVNTYAVTFAIFKLIADKLVVIDDEK